MNRDGVMDRWRDKTKRNNESKPRTTLCSSSIATKKKNVSMSVFMQCSAGPHSLTLVPGVEMTRRIAWIECITALSTTASWEGGWVSNTNSAWARQPAEMVVGWAIQTALEHRLDDENRRWWLNEKRKGEVKLIVEEEKEEEENEKRRERREVAKRK